MVLLGLNSKICWAYITLLKWISKIPFVSYTPVICMSDSSSVGIFLPIMAAQRRMQSFKTMDRKSMYLVDWIVGLHSRWSSNQGDAKRQKYKGHQRLGSDCNVIWSKGVKYCLDTALWQTAILSSVSPYDTWDRIQLPSDPDLSKNFANADLLQFIKYLCSCLHIWKCTLCKKTVHDIGVFLEEFLCTLKQAENSTEAPLIQDHFHQNTSVFSKT